MHLGVLVFLFFFYKRAGVLVILSFFELTVYKFKLGHGLNIPNPYIIEFFYNQWILKLWEYYWSAAMQNCDPVKQYLISLKEKCVNSLRQIFAECIYTFSGDISFSEI